MMRMNFPLVYLLASALNIISCGGSGGGESEIDLNPGVKPPVIPVVTVSQIIVEVELDEPAVVRIDGVEQTSDVTSRFETTFTPGVSGQFTAEDVPPPHGERHSAVEFRDEVGNVGRYTVSVTIGQ
jgi:hypothetical protein